MDEQERLRRADLIKKRIENANSILIVSSKPVDTDTLCTSLTLQWWIQQMYRKSPEIITLAPIPESYKKDITAAVDNVKEVYFSNIKFDNYDLIIGVDANAWYMQFSSDFDISLIHKHIDKFVHIDHHLTGEIAADLGEASLSYKDSCTSKLVYFHFVKPSGIKIPSFVAEWMYKALLYDTGVFSWEMYPGTFTMAEELLACGLDHQKYVELHIPKSQMDFIKVILPKVKYYPEIGTQILVIDEAENDLLSELFGNDWSTQRLYQYYNEVVYRRIEGYNYAFTFTKDFKKGGVDVSWRARNYGKLISVKDFLTSLGFDAGGHPGAGGGYSAKLHISEVEELCVTKMKEALKDKGSYQLSAVSDQK